MALTGASGFVGAALKAALSGRGHRVLTVSRSRGDLVWDHESLLPQSALSGVEAIIHLAGEPINQRWNRAVKRRIEQSRVVSTQRLVEAMGHPNASVKTFICASGINFYGTTVDQPVDESAAQGDGFLARVCARWESAAAQAETSKCRVVRARTGIVLDPAGGVLAKLLPLFRRGMGGKLGSGQQAMSWISLFDLVAAYVYLLESETASGAYNLVAPECVTNEAFTNSLAAALGRGAFAPVPPFMLRLLMGEMVDETALSDLAVKPSRLAGEGFEWRHHILHAYLESNDFSPE